MLHELGHALGFNHYDGRPDVMNTYYFNGGPNRHYNDDEPLVIKKESRMRYSIGVGLVAASTLVLTACQTESSSPGPSTSASCVAPMRMSDGEIVTYQFTYANGEQTKHTITKVADGDESGEIVYSASDGRASNRVLKDVCSEKNSVPLGREEAFLLTGASLIMSDSQDDSSSAPAPLEFSEESCTEQNTIVPAGEFAAVHCRYIAANSNVSFTQTSQQTLGGAKPLGGLLNYELNNTNHDVVVELIEWNGI